MTAHDVPGCAGLNAATDERAAIDGALALMVAKDGLAQVSAALARVGAGPPNQRRASGLEGGAGAPLERRSIDDRLGEALRRLRCGLIRPLWRDLPDDKKDGWINTANLFRRTVLADVGLTVAIDGEGAQ